VGTLVVAAHGLHDLWITAAVTYGDGTVITLRADIRRYGRFSGHLMLAADRNRMVDLRAGQGLGALPRPRWPFQRLL
jgi:hypothetical protein